MRKNENGTPLSVKLHFNIPRTHGYRIVLRAHRKRVYLLAKVQLNQFQVEFRSGSVDIIFIQSTSNV